MKINEVSVEVKRVYNYQTYSVGLKATIEDNDIPEDVVRSLQQTANKLAIEKIKKDYGKKNEN